MSNKSKEYLEDPIDDMALLVVSYDGYSDLWDDFFHLLNLNWSNRPYPTYLANNIKPARYAGVEVINCGETAQWSTRTRHALRIIKAPYVCLLLEDHFIGEQVDDNLIKDAIELMIVDRLKYYKLSSLSKINTAPHKEFTYLKVIPSSLEYGISLQAAIWEKQYLLDLIGPRDYDAWEFEIDRISETNFDPESPKIGCVYDNRNILNIVHGVVQGKFLPSAIDYFARKNYAINANKRKVMSRFEYFFYELKRKGKSIIPKRLRGDAKRLLSAFGFQFVVTDKRKNG